MTLVRAGSALIGHGTVRDASTASTCPSLISLGPSPPECLVAFPLLLRRDGLETVLLADTSGELGKVRRDFQGGGHRGDKRPSKVNGNMRKRAELTR